MVLAINTELLPDTGKADTHRNLRRQDMDRVRLQDTGSRVRLDMDRVRLQDTVSRVRRLDMDRGRRLDMDRVHLVMVRVRRLVTGSSVRLVTGRVRHLVTGKDFKVDMRSINTTSRLGMDSSNTTTNISMGLDLIIKEVEQEA
jgi:hypothetical protein